MTKYILKDKLSYPITFTFFWGIVQFTEYKNDWDSFVISLLFFLVILSFLSFSMTDNYIQKNLIENESIHIEYQKNFLKDKPNIFTTDSKSIESFEFSSSSFLGSSYSISIKFIDENNLYDKITFKTNNDSYFIDLIYVLKKIKTKHNISV